MAGKYCLDNFYKEPNQLIEEDDDFGTSEEQFNNPKNPPVEEN